MKILWEPCRLLGPLLKTGLALIGNVLKPIGKNELRNNFELRNFELRNDVMKIVKSLEESGLLIKGVSQIIKYKAKE